MTTTEICSRGGVQGLNMDILPVSTLAFAPLPRAEAQVDSLDRQAPSREYGLPTRDRGPLKF